MAASTAARNRKSLFWKIPLTVLLAAAALFLAVNAWVCLRFRGSLLTSQDAAAQQADCILVLGAGVRADGTPSPMLEDRLLQAIALYEAGAAPKLLVSGDHGTANYDEVNTMKQYCLRQGVPSGDIFMDHAGFSTYESMYRAQAVFQAEKIIIVTQRYHLYRAVYVARSLGLDACGVASDLRSYAGQSYYSAREMLARVKDFAMVIYRPLPLVLGEPISLTGDGDCTNDRDD